MSAPTLGSTHTPAAGAAGARSEQQVRRDWLLLACATIAFGFGFGINSGLTPNFTAEHLGIAREQLGLLESLREVPGLLTAGLVGLVAFLPRPRMAAVALVIFGIGIALTGQVSAYWPLVAVNVFWSIGLHIWLTVWPSLTLTLSSAGRHGQSLGLMNRYMAVALVGGLLLVRLLGAGAGYAVPYVLGGVAIATGGWFVLRLTPEPGGQIQQRLVFRWRYWRYYGLALLDGGRRQVVQTFALLILVKEFSVPREQVAVLLVLNSILTMAVAPLVGHWTDRLGERRVLLAYYLLVAVLFTGYTQIEGTARVWAVPPAVLFSILFAIDSLLFTASVGIQTYIRHTAPPEELSASLAMGLTWNHVAAVSVPITAGWIWQQYGYERIFACGIGMALLSAAMCLTLPRRVGE